MSRCTMIMVGCQRDKVRDGCFWFLGAVVATLLFCALHLTLGQHHAFGPSWLESDQGWYLTQLSELVEGKLIYQDIATPYGPLAFYWHLLWVSFFGISPAVFLVASGFVVALANGVIAFGLRQHMERVSVSAIIILSAVCIQQYNTGVMLITVPWAMLELGIVICLWNRGTEASFRRNILIGLVLGLGQLNKFGYFAVLSGSIACADVLACSWTQPRQTALGLLKRWMTIGVGFICVETVWLAYLFGRLDYAFALDAAWPSYQVEAYRRAFGKEEELWGAFKYLSLPYFVGRIVPILLMLILGIIGYVVGRRHSAHPRAFQFALGGLAYIVAMILFFHDIHALVLHLWMLFGFLIYAFIVGPKVLRTFAVLVAAAMTAVFPVRWYRAALERPEAVQVTENIRLWMPEIMAQKYSELVTILDEHIPASDLIFVYDWEGIPYVTGRKSVGRHSWPLRGWVREHELERLHRDLDRLSYFVLEKRPGYSEGLLDESLGSDSERVESEVPFPDEYAQFFATKAGRPQQIGEKWIVVPLVVKDEARPGPMENGPL